MLGVTPASGTMTISSDGRRLGVLLGVLLGTTAPIGAQCSTQVSPVVTAFPIHSMDRPQPAVVTPAPPGASPPAPSDAIVLFDGRDLANWQSADTSAAPAWIVKDGYMQVAGKTGIFRRSALSATSSCTSSG